MQGGHAPLHEPLVHLGMLDDQHGMVGLARKKKRVRHRGEGRRVHEHPVEVPAERVE
jgi:hypothetical protein